MSRRILLHVCCGPCSIHPVERLQAQGFEVTGVFTNPNIHPAGEYLLRREAALAAAEKLGIRLIVKDADYDPGRWLRQIAFREANRCILCAQMRLERTLHLALAGNFDAFSTTLLYSKRQKHDEIARLGADLATDRRVTFHYEDFRQGWTHGMERSQEWGLYRQQWCGCLLSETERVMGKGGKTAGPDNTCGGQPAG